MDQHPPTYEGSLVNRTLPLIGLATAGLLALSACGSSASDTSSQAAGMSQGGYRAGQAGGSPSFPGASGKIAAKSGKTLQVQGPDSQTAVSYTGSTTITQQVTASLAAVKVGTCVMVEPVRGGSSSASDSGSSTVAAASVSIIAKTNGSCDTQRGGFRRAGGRPPGMASGRPSGVPSDMPSGGRSAGPGGRGGFVGFGAFGEVTAVTADGFTVKSTRPRRSGDSGQSSTTYVSVTVSKSTTVTSTKTASPAALKVGQCVTATGKTDDTGAVTAQRIAVTSSVDGQCTGGFGGFRRGGQSGSTRGSVS